MLGILGTLFRIYFGLLGLALELLIGLWALLAGPGRTLLGRLAAGVALASRVLTPARVLAFVVGAAALLLALSQFVDYRAINIGTGDYALLDAGSVAPAPEVGREQAGDPHAYAMVPLAALSLLLLGAALRGRWRLCRLISLAGVAAVLLALLVDRPTGLDLGRAALAYEGAKATLLEGFYAQIFSGLLLGASSLLLARELQEATATQRRAIGRGLGRHRLRRGSSERRSPLRGARA